MLTITVDIVLGVVVTGVFALVVRRTTRWMGFYLFVPTVLVWTHVVGNALQELKIGSAWVQAHLHDVGVATCILPGALAYGSYRWQRSHPGRAFRTSPDFARALMRSTLIGHLVGTLGCIAYKVGQITVFREESLAKGYSGDLDIGDSAAFVVGFLVMLANYVVMSRVVSRKM